MQYQVYKEDTGEMVAWIDPESIVQIVKNGYAIKCGENLKANESEDEENEECKETQTEKSQKLQK